MYNVISRAYLRQFTMFRSSTRIVNHKRVAPLHRQAAVSSLYYRHKEMYEFIYNLLLLVMLLSQQSQLSPESFVLPFHGTESRIKVFLFPPQAPHFCQHSAHQFWLYRRLSRVLCFVCCNLEQKMRVIKGFSSHFLLVLFDYF